MTTSAIIALVFALIKSAGPVLAFLQSLHTAAQSKADQGIGYDQAVADGLAAAHAGLLAAIEAENAAKASGDAHPNDDSGFDPEFERDD